jgi:UPF0716 protein FxsA
MRLVYAEPVAIFLFLLFIILPLAELYVIVQVGQSIGIWWTLAILLADSFIGAYLARTQGRAVWDRFNMQMSAGKVPAREIVDGAMIILGGALLLTPGFITDIFGIILLLPPTRAICRGVMRKLAGRHPAGRPAFFVYDRFGNRAGRPNGNAAAGADPRTAGSPPPRRPTSAGPQSARGVYDVEGTAHEIPEDEHRLPRSTPPATSEGSDA